MNEFAQKEIQKLSKRVPFIIAEGAYKLGFKSEEELVNVLYELAYFSRTIENIYLIAESDDDISLEKQIIKVNNTNFEVYNLIGFNLSRRDYKNNVNSDSLNPLILNYCFYLLELDKKRSPFSIIDPNANLGDTMIEASLFSPRAALNVKARHSFPFYRLFLPLHSPAPKPLSNSNVFNAIVNDSVHFKQLKENLSATAQKIKISKFTLDWLDVKFHNGDFDFVISSFPLFRSDDDSNAFQKDFFYQSEFICKKLICVISRQKIEMKFLKEFKLSIKELRQIEFENIKYYIYIIGK